MNTIELYRSTTHPPDTEDRQTLTIPDEASRARLAPTDRLTLRLGLWLVERSARPAAPPQPRSAPRPTITEREALTLLTYDLQRQLR